MRHLVAVDAALLGDRAARRHQFPHNWRVDLIDLIDFSIGTHFWHLHGCFNLQMGVESRYARVDSAK